MFCVEDESVKAEPSKNIGQFKKIYRADVYKGASKRPVLIPKVLSFGMFVTMHQLCTYYTLSIILQWHEEVFASRTTVKVCTV